MIMKKSLKYINVFMLLLISVICFNLKFNAYTETGHEDFQKIEVEGIVKLLNEYTDSEINEKVKNIPFKLFGWSTVTINKNIPMKYDGKILFARSNKTSQAVKLEYVLKETEITETSVKIKGSVSAKITGQIKKIHTDITGNLSYERVREEVDEYEKETELSLNMQIKPNTKLILITTGEGVVTNGVSKLTLFGITVKKGGWERIDVQTVYFEFREEVL